MARLLITLVIVLGLFAAGQVADTREMQDRLKAASQLERPDDSGWYLPFSGGGKYEKALCSRAEAQGGNWLAESPWGMARVIEHLEATGVVGMISEHFQERPALSLQKSAMAAVKPELTPSGWHRDGSFLGGDVRAINVWIALSHC